METHVTKQAKAFWQIQNKDEVFVDEQRIFDTFLSDRPTANVGMSVSYPFKVFEYGGTMKIDVSLYMPSYPEMIEETFEYVHEWVNEKMKELVIQTQKMIKK
jgi:hypothetical protein